MKRPYYVVSPEYKTSLGGAYEPPEYGCDCVEVEAETKREAVILGVREALKQRHSWAEDNRSDGQSPFAGYRAELAVCPHGHPHFVMVAGKPVYLRSCWACNEPTSDEVCA